MPVYFYKCLVVGVAGGALLERLPKPALVRRLSSPALLSLVVVAFWALLSAHTGPDRLRTFVHPRMRQWTAGREWRTQSVYGVDFGAFGLYTGARVFDGPGLVYPPSLDKYHCDPQQILRGEQPDWALMTYTREQMRVILSPEFAAVYRPVVRFSEHGDTSLVFPPVDQIPTVWSHDFVLFQRNTAR